MNWINKVTASLKLNQCLKVTSQFFKIFEENWGLLLSVVIFTFLWIEVSFGSSISPTLNRQMSIFFFLILLVIALKRILYSKSLYLAGLIVLSLAFFSLSGILSLDNFILTGGNNDVYNWALASNTINGFSQYTNIMPHGAAIWTGLKQDAAGAYILNGFLPLVFGKNALEFVTVNIMVVGLLTQLAIYELAKKMRFNDSVAFMTALSFGAGSLYLYLLANYFFAQLVATLFLIISLILYVDLSRKSYPRFFRVICLTPPIFIMFVSYQSAFLPIIFALGVGAVLYADVKFDIDRTLFQRLRSVWVHSFSIALDLVMVCLVVFILSPSTTLHLIDQVIFISVVTAGWSLTPMNILSIIGVPSYYKIDYGLGLLSFGMFVLSFLLVFGLRSLNFSNRLFWHFLFISVSYLLYYFFSINPIEANNYKVWKLAAYLVLPLGSFLVANFYLKISSLSGRYKYLLLIFVTCFCCVSHFNIGKTYFYDKTKIYEEFVRYQSSLSAGGLKGHKVILDTEAYADTMIAFNVFSKEHTLFPLNPWYSSPFKAADLEMGKSVLIAKSCNENKNSKYELYDTDKNHEKFMFYEFRGCGFFGHFIKNEGLSGIEPTGRWSDGDHVSFEITRLPKFKPFKNIYISVDPYLPNGIVSQKFEILLNEISIGKYEITNHTKLKIPCSSGLKCNIDFIFENPLRPIDFNNSSRDTRDISLFFKKIYLGD